MVGAITSYAPSGVILAFHQTSEKHYPGVNNLKPGYFYAILALLQEWGFTLWNGQVPISHAHSGPYAVITFDDGYEDNFELLKSLCTDSVRPIVFVPGNFIGRANSWEYSSALFPARHLRATQLKQLSDLGVIFGSHGLSHRSLAGMSLSEIDHELTSSKKQIEAIIEQTVDLLSFPFGRYNTPVCRAAKESGYRHAMILGERQRIEEQDDFILPRTAIYGFDDYYSLRRKIFRATPFERTKRAIVGRLAGGTITFKSRLK